MSDKEFNLSRRKALGAIGSIGVATTLGGLATSAQFTDSEKQSYTFSAGAVDGTLAYSANYNGNQVKSMDGGIQSYDNVGDGSGVGTSLHLTDVKPGDYGSFLFELTVKGNPAWVASCVGYKNNHDWNQYEPEMDAEDELTGHEFDGSHTDEEIANGKGELAENILLIPFYDSDDSSVFFDSGGSTGYPGDGGATASSFWSNAEGDHTAPVSGDNYLQPRTLKDISENVEALNTKQWNGDSHTTIPAPDGSTADPGCVFLDGAQAGGSSSDNTRKASALEPGDTLYFGYDWHLPFDVGNAAQGDKVDIQLGFNFLQQRHTDAPNLANVYSPGSNTPN